MPGDLQKTNCDGSNLNGIWQMIYEKNNFQGSDLTVPNPNKVSKRSINLTVDFKSKHRTVNLETTTSQQTVTKMGVQT